MSDGAPDFSFSGLKTAVSLHVRRAGPLDPARVADVAASFQATAVKMLVRKTVKAAVRAGVRRLVLTGGVAANTALREALEGECRERGWALHVPSRRLCTDNAAMIRPPADRLEAASAHCRQRGPRSGAREPRHDYEALIAGRDAVVGVDDGLRVMLWNRRRNAARPVGRRTIGRALKKSPPGLLVRRGRHAGRSEPVESGGDRERTSVHVSAVTAPLAVERRRGARWRCRDMTASTSSSRGAARQALAAVGQWRSDWPIRPLGLTGSGSWPRMVVALREHDVLLKWTGSPDHRMLLDISRPFTLRLVLNLHQLLERVALLAEEMAAQHGVQIVRRYDPSLPAILADEDRILQVFHNLVRNAVEAMTAGGRLTLVTRLSMNPLFAKVDGGLGQRSMAEIQVWTRARASGGHRSRLFPFFTKDKGWDWAGPLPPDRRGASRGDPDRQARRRGLLFLPLPDRIRAMPEGIS
jgi:hypothetical protein